MAEPSDLEVIQYMKRKSGGSSYEPTDEEIIQHMQQTLGTAEPPSFGQKALGVVQKVGETIDKYTGAPTRAAISAAQNTENPLSAFASQFGQDPSLAPTGKDIVKKAGVPDTALSDIIPGAFSESGDGIALQKGGLFDPTASGTLGLATDIAGDVSNIIPGVAAAKLLGRAGKGALSLGGKIIGKSIKFVTPQSVQEQAKIINESAKNVAKSLHEIVTPKQADNIDEMFDIAKRNGLAKTLDDLPIETELGPSSTATKIEAHRRGTRGEDFAKKHTEIVKKTEEAVKNTISDIAGGIPPNAVQAGDLIREGYHKSVDDFFSQIDITHDSVIDEIKAHQKTIKDAGGSAQDVALAGKLDPSSIQTLNGQLNKIADHAKELLELGTDIEKKQGRELLSVINSLRKNIGDYESLTKRLRSIGNTAFKNKGIIGQIPPDIKSLREIYFAIDDALIDTVSKRYDDSMAAVLKNNKELMSVFYGEKSKLAPLLNNFTSGEDLFNRVIMNGSTEELSALKSLFSNQPEIMNKVKGTFLESLLKTKFEGEFNFKQALERFKGRENEIAYLFDNPEEIKRVTDLLRLGKTYGPVTQGIPAIGGSGVYNRLENFVENALVQDSFLANARKRARTKAQGKQAPQIQGKQPLVGNKELLLRSGAKGAQTLSVDKQNDNKNAIKRRLQNRGY